MTAESTWLRLLSADRVLQLSFVIHGGLLLFLVLGTGPFGDYIGWLGELLTPISVGLVVAAMLWGSGRLARRERRFWALLAAAWGCWLLVDLFYYFDPPLLFSSANFLTDGLYIFFYFIFALAIDLRPHVARRAPWTGLRRRLESGAGLAAACGLLFYFALVALPEPLRLSLSFVPRERGLTPVLLVRLSLDMLLVGRLAYATFTSTGIWSRSYALLSGTMFCYGLKDVFALLQYRGLLSVARAPQLYEIFLLLPGLLAIVATRARHLAYADGSSAIGEPPPGGAGEVARPSLLSLYALVVPGLHFILYPLGLLDASTRPAREVFSLLYMVVLGTLAWVHQRLVTIDADRARSALRAAEQRLFRSQRMEAVGRLAGGIAHDFNNYLTVIRGYGDLLKQRVRDPKWLADLEYIDDAAKKATHLTQQILAFGGRQVLRPEALDLNEVVLETSRLLETLLGDDVALEVDLDPAVGLARADLGQTEQVLMNLALNARDAMPGGGTVAIQTAPFHLSRRAAEKLEIDPGRYALLVVKDTGEGMTEEVRARALEPFFTTKGPGRGTGLGLSTVYGIVTQSGGALRLTSAPGEGTTVLVLLPIADGGLGPEIQATPQAAPDSGATTLLLVEDQEQVRSLASRVLARRGFRVLEAADGREALDRFPDDSEPLDLLLTDIVMPEVDGIELARALVARRPALKVLFVSGYPTETLRERHVDLPKSFPLLEKPYTPASLLEAVQRALANGPPDEITTF